MHSLTNAEVISIGSELLNGFTLNTNAHWISGQLTDLGIKLTRVTAVEDTKDAIVSILQEAIHRDTKIIICTGGLGPTLDDITKKTIADFFNRTLELDTNVLEHVKNLFHKRNIPMPEVNVLQAHVPSGSKALHNEYGTAPGIYIEENDKHFFFLPGVPYEMKYIFLEHITPMIKKYCLEGKMYYKTITTRGIGESALMEILSEWEQEVLKDGIDLCYYPSTRMVKLRLSKISINQEQFEKYIQQHIISLKHKILPYWIGTENIRLEELLGNMLKTNKASLGTVESCTGGYLAHLITSVSGSSEYFKGSIVSYDNEVKTNIVGVQEDLIQLHGAVSEEVVMQMAKSGLHRLNVDYCIATSGIAGPNGGTPEKPVGTIWMAIAGKNLMKAKKMVFGKDRLNNIQLFSFYALDYLMNELPQEV